MTTQALLRRRSSTPLLSKAALASAIQSNQPSQGLPIQPKSLHGYQENSELGLLGARQGWGWDLLIRDCEKAVTHAYSCPNNPQQNIYTVHEINNFKKIGVKGYPAAEGMEPILSIAHIYVRRRVCKRALIHTGTHANS